MSAQSQKAESSGNAEDDQPRGSPAPSGRQESNNGKSWNVDCRRVFQTEPDTG